MAKGSIVLVKMTSTGTMPDGALTGTYYVAKVNPKKVKGDAKLRRRAYDKRIRKHVWFEQKKMPSHSA